MLVQSIKIAELNSKKYSSEPNQKVDSRFNQATPKQDEFSLVNRSNQKISFGVSVEYYANKYLHSSNFNQALRDEIRSDLSTGKKFLNFIFDSYESEVQDKFNAVKKSINEMLEEIERKRKREQDHLDYLRGREREAAREADKLRKEQEEVNKKIKLSKINSQKENLVLENNKLDLEEKNIALEKELLQDQKFSNYSDTLKIKFINLAQNEKTIKSSGGNIFPNGIMLSNFDEGIGTELIQWTAKKSDCKLKEIDFADFSEEEVLKELMNVAKEAQDNDKRTLIHIKNFEKFTTPINENEKIIGKLKNFLQKCAGEYKCTVITEVKNPKKLSPEITADQRFKLKIDGDD